MKTTRTESKAKRSTMDTIAVDLRTVNGWRIPPFQRPLRVNDKVRAIAEAITADGGVIPGVLTIGKIPAGRDSGEYLIDGQHRIEAFRMSGADTAYADVRYVEFIDMADMGDEFVALNSRIVNMRPDDVLRGLEGSTETLRLIREACPFVGYDNVRRNGNTSPMLSMSTVLRVWEGSATETPVSINRSAMQLAKDMTHESATQCRIFLQMALEAWGREEASKRLWGALNMSLCMWLWRRLVLDKERRGTRRYVSLTSDRYKKCLMSLAANADYNDWLMGRALGDRDRPAAYARIKGIMSRRILEEKWESKVSMPSPAWAKS